nr:uncharacterized protein CTRU02_01527 [Colletotrichum truncatum]KAF6799848.1 hypothetical protein CTRU02_01527 [Colletotrichum truncatum]
MSEKSPYIVPLGRPEETVTLAGVPGIIDNLKLITIRFLEFMACRPDGDESDAAIFTPEMRQVPLFVVMETRAIIPQIRTVANEVRE